jgi:glycosyltransferase involved in cell wall biosynthesis
MIAAATAVVNSSISEGICGVLLESMALRVPVLARGNAGNQALVQHEVRLKLSWERSLRNDALDVV